MMAVDERTKKRNKVSGLLSGLKEWVKACGDRSAIYMIRTEDGDILINSIGDMSRNSELIRAYNAEYGDEFENVYKRFLEATKGQDNDD